MPTHSLESSASSDLGSRYSAIQISRGLLTVVALAYAFLAGLHTLQDFDLGWQLATGRWVLQNRHVFSTDVFSYTAAGQPWIYPVVSGVIFYVVYLAGGYALLSWIGALATAATFALLLRRHSLITCALAVVAAPLIANRTQPRAEMFTTVLFAAFLSLLWRHYRTGESRMWLLPVLMVAWVNLHLGFVAGLALCAAYVLLEILDLPFASNRSGALARLRRGWPWLALTAIATLINPWGPLLYMALVRQARAQSLHTSWIVEWENIRPSWTSFHQVLDWRDPQSCFWWLILVTLAGACIALWRKHWGAAALLIVSAYATTQHVRLQALFACVAVIVGGAMLDELINPKPISEKRERADSKTPPSANRTQFATAGVLLVTVAITSLAAVRSWDLISNRYYMRSAQLSVFGTGLSGWFPERAIDFLQREKLPANVFNGYSLGGYLTWRLFPDYRDYIDSRAVPFGPQLFFRAYDLSVEPPDSPVWQQEAEARGINTILVPLARYQGMTLFPQLRAFCRSQSWKPVYLDEVSAIFVRRSSQTESLIDRLQVDCDKISFDQTAHLSAATMRQTGELFNASANAGGVLYSLARYPEALAQLDRAQAIFADNANVHLLRGLVLEETAHPTEAEAEFRASLRLEPNDETWFDLGLFYMTQRRYAEAVDVFRQSAESSSRPHEMWMMLGQAELQMHQPQPALDAFDKAVEASPYGSEWRIARREFQFADRDRSRQGLVPVGRSATGGELSGRSSQTRAWRFQTLARPRRFI